MRCSWEIGVSSCVLLVLHLEHACPSRYGIIIIFFVTAPRCFYSQCSRCECVCVCLRHTSPVSLPCSCSSCSAFFGSCRCSNWTDDVGVKFVSWCTIFPYVRYVLRVCTDIHISTYIPMLLQHTYSYTFMGWFARVSNIFYMYTNIHIYLIYMNGVCLCVASAVQACL